MSRIHEALKKAELERESQVVQTAPAFDRQTSESSDERADTSTVAASVAAAASTATEVLAQPSVTTEPLDGPLRFEDLRARCTHTHWHPNPAHNVFSDLTMSGDSAEQFRTLRSRLYQMRNIQPLQTVLITSAVPGDGKTFVTHNLAQAIVRQPDRHVLVIDGDLRSSRLHASLGAPKTPGLSDYLRGDVDEWSIIQRGQESDLFMIPGGQAVANPSELLSNVRLKALVDRVAPLFDWIIFDSPPCVPVADARMIAEVCDGVILVVRAGATPSESAQKAAQEFQGKGIVGVVLNTVARSAFAYSSYYGSVYDSHANNSHKPKPK